MGDSTTDLTLVPGIFAPFRPVRKSLHLRPKIGLRTYAETPTRGVFSARLSMHRATREPQLDFAPRVTRSGLHAGGHQVVATGDAFRESGYSGLDARTTQ